MTIWYNIPIEDIPTRYSHQWNQWFPEAFDLIGGDVFNIADARAVAVDSRHFLDPVATNQYKAWQTDQLMDVAASFNEDTILWFHDLWHPALIQLIYLRHVAGLKFKIAGVLFAGAHDPYDLLAQRNYKQWASLFERSVFPHIDLIIVGSCWHRSLVLRTSKDIEPQRVCVLPYPVKPLTPGIKEKLIVWPHRVANEKQPGLARALLDDVCSQLYGWSYVMTQAEAYSQEQYYDALSRAAICLSTSLQETFGIAMIESILAGCWPLMPRRLSYKELHPQAFLYGGNLEVRKRLLRAMNNFDIGQMEKSEVLPEHRERLLRNTEPMAACMAMLHIAQKMPRL